ncbi:hypothetical protein [Bacillus sp. Marseille-P3661]|uniref:hypothetical protein n=1 Tax=Bacillus sp. Marseille-P3661 TaxID=1936234 RepID=UPI000C81726F|nr:hypothetical protein [Bacillus sp. Marseille-P3661]
MKKTLLFVSSSLMSLGLLTGCGAADNNNNDPMGVRNDNNGFNTENVRYYNNDNRVGPTNTNTRNNGVGNMEDNNGLFDGNGNNNDGLFDVNNNNGNDGLFDVNDNNGNDGLFDVDTNRNGGNGNGVGGTTRTGTTR